MNSHQVPKLSFRQKAAQRLRENFQLSIITLFGICSILVITPFSIYRALNAEWLIAALDLGLVLAISASCAWAWRSGETRTVGIMLAVVYSCGVVASSEMLGIIGAIWIYPVALANFFLVGRSLAWLITLVAIGVLATHPEGAQRLELTVSFVATAVVVSFLSAILANRTEAQRRQLETLASHDPLTGVFNRRAMGEELARAVELRRRGGLDTSLLLIDIDHFKRINDWHGHAAGDRVLVDFCAILRRNVRSVDMIFRFGGEEFLVLLPGMSGEVLKPFIEKLRAQIAAELRTPSGPITVCAGGATLRPEHGWEEWINRADMALYRAKASGRNCSEIEC